MNTPKSVTVQLSINHKDGRKSTFENTYDKIKLPTKQIDSLIKEQLEKDKTILNISGWKLINNN